jgi:hypothetical protein
MNLPLFLLLFQSLVTVAIDRVPDPGSPWIVYWVLKTQSSALEQYTVELTFVPVDGNSIKQQVTPTGSAAMRYTAFLGPVVPIKSVSARVLLDVPVQVTYRQMQ